LMSWSSKQQMRSESHVMAHGRRVGVMPESGGPDGNIAIGQHSPQLLAFANWQRAHVE